MGKHKHKKKKKHESSEEEEGDEENGGGEETARGDKSQEQLNNDFNEVFYQDKKGHKLEKMKNVTVTPVEYTEYELEPELIVSNVPKGCFFYYFICMCIFFLLFLTVSVLQMFGVI